MKGITTMVTEQEFDELEQNVDALTAKIAAACGDEEAIAKAEGIDAEFSKVAAEVDAIADDVNAELDKRASDMWDERVAKIAKAHDISLHQAMQKCRAENPALFEQYQKSTPGVNRALGFQPLGPEGARKANQAFESAVREIAANSGCSMPAAMTKARQMYPDLYRAYQGE